MTLYEHAKRELEIIACSEPERSALLAAVECFSKGGWSGGSVGWGIETLTRLLEYKPLSDISSDPDEWMHVNGPETNNESVWQNRRRSSSFSRDGGTTWYDIDDPSLNRGDVWDREAGKWSEVLLGSNTKVGYKIKIKNDAYSNERLASMHNGRIGVLVGTRNGLCVVRYDDGLEFQHEADKLVSKPA